MLQASRRRYRRGRLSRHHSSRRVACPCHAGLLRQDRLMIAAHGRTRARFVSNGALEAAPGRVVHASYVAVMASRGSHGAQEGGRDYECYGCVAGGSSNPQAAAHFHGRAVRDHDNWPPLCDPYRAADRYPARANQASIMRRPSISAPVSARFLCSQ